MDGNVIKIPCMQADCKEEFTDDDVKRFGSKKTFDKYLRFKMNINVDLNPNLRWCPNQKCVNYVEKQGKSNTATCECGTKVCMECGEVDHPGTKCG